MTLARLLGEGRPQGALVATGDAEARDLRRLHCDVAALAGALRAREPSPGARWVVVCDDSYAFAVGLLSVWHAGGVAVSPPNAQAGTLEEIAGGVAGWLSDVELPLGAARGERLHPLRPPPAPADALGPLDREAWVLELFTSGTTARGRGVCKRLRHLDDEVAWLERRFGAELGPAEVFSTASHQHLYAMLFRLLWPLAAGRPFRSETFLHAEELVPRVVASGRAVLASTPAHLRRLVERADVAKLAPACRAVFSSGGPLDAETADRLAEALGAAPIEIFGSTETGGVAWRRQRPGPERLAFAPFEGVALECTGDGRLRVRSPYGDGADGPEGLVMGDRATLLADGRFRLEGRADRTVKVGEKRLSLPDMERVLLRHPDVRDAALLRLGAEGAARVAAVVVLGASGRERLEREGRRALGASLGEHLTRHFDRALAPRAWRYVAAVPEDPQGKRPQALLEPLFVERAAPASAPRVLAEERGADRLARELEVPADLVYFDGHFPVYPVLPGVAQLAWVMDAARVLLGCEPRVARLEALKFASPVRPEDRLRLELERRPGGLRFRVLRGASEVASGRLALRQEATASGGRGGPA
jgi:acyl-coenzyme A synthetase/AMP-(fatty) acid ligase/3-hydroxymyristoyl/3-hydroxydecanoyl-(acyl carrier protein) dehydratase